MRPARNFAVLRLRAERRLRRLRDLGSAACASLHDKTSKLMVSHVTIELHNVWSGFARSYFVSCVLRPRRENGGIVSVTITPPTAQAAIALVTRKYRPKKVNSSGIVSRRDEPSWQNPSIFMDCCTLIGCSHILSIQSAMSAPTRVFSDLPVFRNFFAHRNEDTEQEARSLAPSYGIPSSLRAIDVVSRAPLNRPYPLLVDWIDDVTQVVQALCH